VSEAASHPTKVRDTIGFARYALAGEYMDEAGRNAYMTAYHAWAVQTDSRKIRPQAKATKAL
jgi:hypothetical protein